MLARVLKTITPPSDPHERLRQAKAARAEAQAALEEARAALERVQEVIAQSSTADRAARKAHAAAHQEITEWAASGADPAGRCVFAKLQAEAAEADRLADLAESTATAARAGFPAAEQLVSECESKLFSAADRVGQAVDAILLAELAEHLEVIEEAALAYSYAIAPVRALLRVTASRATRDAICAVLDRSRFPVVPESERRGELQHGDVVPDEVAMLLEPLKARVRELREDPLPRWQLERAGE